MYIKLYTCNDDVKTVNKVLTGEKTLSASITGSCSIHTPMLKLSTYENISTYNYVYVPDFNRYYFIKDITIETGGKIMLSCLVDVLYTYRTYFNDMLCCVVRSESIGKPTEVVDTSLPINQNKKQTLVIDLGKSIFTTTPDTPYMLTVQGT